jgi:hypothetical protein
MMTTNSRMVLAVAVTLMAVSAGLAGCATNPTTAPATPTGGSTAAATAENNPPGDIPDNQAFVPYTPPEHLFAVAVPEGWARTTQGVATVFTDKSNSVRIETRTPTSAPTVDTARADELPVLEATTPGFHLGGISTVDRKAGQVVLITYTATSPPNPVTGNTGTDAVERYAFWHNNDEVILTLSGAVGADNVDPWRTITDSLQWM